MKTTKTKIPLTDQERAVRTITRRVSTTNTLLFLILVTQWVTR